MHFANRMYLLPRLEIIASAEQVKRKILAGLSKTFFKQFQRTQSIELSTE